MQFQVPQFIEVEDKIIGPLTFKQFIYVAGAAGLSYIVWSLLPRYIALFVIPATLGLGAALAFMQWNGRPFIVGLESGFYYLISSKLYLWSSARKTKSPKKTAAVVGNDAVSVPKLADSRLHELAWSLDIKEKLDKAGLSNPDERRGRQDALAPVKVREGFAARN